MTWPVERTATRAVGQPDGVLSDLNFGEVFPFVAKPLTRDFLARYIGPLLCAQFANLPRSHSLVQELNPMGFVAGRPYMDLSAYITLPSIAHSLQSLESVDQSKGRAVLSLARAGRLHPLPLPMSSRIALYVAYARFGMRILGWLLKLDTPVRLLERYRHEADISRSLVQQTLDTKDSASLLRGLDQFQDERDPTSKALQHLSVAMLLHTALQQLLANRVPIALLHDLGQGIPNDFTTEVSLDLWQLTEAARPLTHIFCRTSPDQLPQILKTTADGQHWWAGFERFLARHGHRGEVELDLAAPRWREEPRFLLQTIINYLNHSCDEPTPAKKLAEGVRRRETAAATIRAQLPFRLRLPFDWLYQRYLLWMPFRENGKYTGLLWLEVSRKVYRELGRRLASAGYLNSPDDVFWLRLDELQAWAETGAVGWTGELLEGRRRQWQNWSQLRPPALLIGSDAAATLCRQPEAGELLHGIPASTGMAEGIARVIIVPHESELRAGEILVTRYTDPAWTPLFFTAAALITEVGGVLSHGAVVAREVGLPAIVGVADATTRIRSGQRVRVNATEGTVELLP
jgi:pyruvate,water dikinase